MCGEEGDDGERDWLLHSRPVSAGVAAGVAAVASAAERPAGARVPPPSTSAGEKEPGHDGGATVSTRMSTRVAFSGFSMGIMTKVSRQGVFSETGENEMAGE